MSLNQTYPSACRAFSLIEMLLVIAIIAIMASLVISAFSNAAGDTRKILVRQQQATVQQAVHSWVARESSGADTNGRSRTLESARAVYNNKESGLARLDLVKGYLDDATFEDFSANTASDDEVRTDAMAKTSNYLQLPAWTTNSYPKVILK